MNNKIGLFSRLFFKVPLSEKILFAKHLSMMVKSGMSEVESVRLMRKQVKSRNFGRILDRIIADLEAGQFLSVSLRQFEWAFGQIFINLIEVGEMSGTLADNLNYLSIELKKSKQLKSKIRSALIYPFIILVATVGVTGVIIFFVLPKILPIFYSLHIRLPITTQILIAVTGFLLNYYFAIIAGIIALVFAWILILRISAVRYISHRFILMMPFIGKVAVGYNMANITRTLSVLLKSGVKIVEGIIITSGIVTNVVYKKVLERTAEEVKKGESLYKYLVNCPSLFPPTATRMIEVGESTGDLESNLLYLADFYENEVDEVTKNLSSVLEPALLLIMGMLVGFLVISIITPIYQVSQGLHQ